MSDGASAGKIIEGKYKLEKKLGAGGMGAVWLATQIMVERHVAVKLLHPAFIDSDDLQARFEVEAKAIGRLNHPNCITLFDFGYSEELGAFYTVIEYVEGIALDKKLGQQLPIAEVVDLARQVAMALDHAHHQGILHRDLKPENIMLARMTDGSEMVKVLDFGIARLAKGDGVQEADRITKAGEVFGTPAYMSPEQARSTRQLTGSSDLYALGVMIFELVEGRLPFFAKSAFDILMMHVTQPVPELSREDVPEQLCDLIYSLLEKDPEARPQSGREVVELLDTIRLHDSPSPARSRESNRQDSLPQPTLLTSPQNSLGDADTESPTDPEDPSDVENPSVAFNHPAAESDLALETESGLSAITTQKRMRVAALVAIVLVSILLLGLVLVNLVKTDDVEPAGSDEPAIATPSTETEAELEATHANTEPLKSNGNELVERQLDSTDDAGVEAPPEDSIERDSASQRKEPTDAKQAVGDPAKVEKKATKTKERRPVNTKTRSPRRPEREPDPKTESTPPEESKPVFPSLSTSDDDDDSVKMPSVDL